MLALKRITALAVLLAAQVAFGTLPGLAAQRIALVIGNAAYKETTPLKNTLNDAKDVAAALKRLGFEVLEGLDLDKRAMERLIRRFDQELTGAEVALFFYAGHGLQVAGQNYLVPTDARLAAEGDIDFESLPLNLVLRRMEREARTSLVLLDACRDNPLARNLARTMGTRSTNVGQGLAEVRTGVGTLIAFSTQPGNVALDGSARNSPYTTALLRNIETPGRDVLSTLAAVRGEVVRATSGRQVPWEHTSLLGPVILRPGAAGTPPLAAASQGASSPSGNPVTTAARRDWEVVENSTSVRELEAYVRRYSGSFYADLAKARIEDLKSQADRKASHARLANAAPQSPPHNAPVTPPADTPICAARAARDGSRYCVSSVLAPQFGNTYGPEHLFDGNPATAWVHGSGVSSVGRAITVIFDRKRTVHGLTLINGYAKSADIFAKNTRVRRLELRFSNGESTVLTLSDDRQRRSIRLPKAVDAEWLQLRIADVYRGTRYADTAISELQVD
ncbi:MAG: caspase family protein [Hyphomicrobiaceae bacterium]